MSEAEHYPKEEPRWCPAPRERSHPARTLPRCSPIKALEVLALFFALNQIEANVLPAIGHGPPGPRTHHDDTRLVSGDGFAPGADRRCPPRGPDGGARGRLARRAYRGPTLPGGPAGRRRIGGAPTGVEAAGRFPELATGLGTSKPEILTFALPSVYGDPRKANRVVKDCGGLEKHAVGRWLARTTKGWRPPAGLQAKTHVRPARHRRPGRRELPSGPRGPSPSEPCDEPGRLQEP